MKLNLHLHLKAVIVAATLMNIDGVLLFSKGFTNTAINNADPVVMSNFGLLMIVVWDFAYLGAATINANAKWLAGAFILEKLVYVVVWGEWLLPNSLLTLFSTDMLSGGCYSIYGLNYFILMSFFMWIFILKQNRELNNEHIESSVLCRLSILT